MSYESPIEIVYREMKNQLENDVYSVMQSYGIKVDKDELIKALEYDREQYLKGYADAKAELKRKMGEWISHENYDECSKCHCFTAVGFNYCPHCGADMRGINENA